MSDEQIYDVVVDADERCATWLAGRDLPEGWHRGSGSRMRFLTRATDMWSGLRPMCLRRRVEDA